MTIGPRPLCLTCIHFKGYWFCDAFDEIPVEIISTDQDHTQPVEGDRGIQYKPDESKVSEDA